MSENATENQPVKIKISGTSFWEFSSWVMELFVYGKTQMEETDTFGVLLSLVLIGIGIYDLYKYFKGV